MSIILHIAHRSAWESASSSDYYKPSSLDSDGFIHCSTIEQTADTANQFYSGQNDLVLLCIDTKKTEAEVKYEAPICANDQRTASLFPHIYGPLNMSAVDSQIITSENMIIRRSFHNVLTSNVL